MTIALLLVLSVSGLHAQENKHAQAMYKAFVETIDEKYSKKYEAKLKSMNADSTVLRYGEWGDLDGGGLVPKEKVNVVKRSKSAATVGPFYIDGHRFSFNHVPDDPTLPLRLILDAFDKQAPFADSYYSYKAGDEQAVFPGVKIAWGEQGETFPLRLDPSMNMRIIGFKDDDGFRSTYLLSWMGTELNEGDTKHKHYMVEGIIYEFHCPKIEAKPQVASYDHDEYLDRTNTGMGVAHNLAHDIMKNDPERARALETDTLMEQYSYKFIDMWLKLYNEPDFPENFNTNFDALNAKFKRMAELSQTATPTEQEAICHTLAKELNSYPCLFSPMQADELGRLTDTIAALVPKELMLQVTSVKTLVNGQRNETADIDLLSRDDQDFLNSNFWTLSHQPIDMATFSHKGSSFTRRGEHYTGDTQKAYFEVDSTTGKDFHATVTMYQIRPGRYRVSAVVRASEAEHSGVHVFCQTGNDTNGDMRHKEIPAMGNAGGNVWFSALCRSEQRAERKEGIYALDINKATANTGRGYGWNRIYLDEITVGSEGTLTYGISTRSEITNSQTIGSSWFSACDFIVERIGE